MQGNAGEIYDSQLKGKFEVKILLIYISETQLTMKAENEISLLPKGLNFVPTYYKVDVARLKLELEQFGNCLKWHFRNYKRDIPMNLFATKSTLTLGIRTQLSKHI